MEASDIRMTTCKNRLRAAGGVLLERAQREGTVRKDAEIGDLLKLTYAIVLAAEKNPDDAGVFNRLMSLTLTGILTRPQQPAAP
jgi:hypothetical protein